MGNEGSQVQSQSKDEKMMMTKTNEAAARLMMKMCDEDVTRMKSGDEYNELRRIWNWPSSQGSSPSPTKTSFWGVETSGAIVRVELVVADMDARFLGWVDKFMRDDVTIRHEPLQQILSESIRDQSNTYFIVGSYGIFPNESDERAGLRSGVSKAISRIFPRSWASFREQSRHLLRSYSGDLPWMELMGHVFLAEPEINGIRLLASVAYPRDQRPTEEDAAARRYLIALKMIMRCENIQSLHRVCPHSKGTPSRYVRVVTHAVGSFVGHDTVDVFAKGLEKALTNLLLKD